MGCAGGWGCGCACAAAAYPAYTVELPGLLFPAPSAVSTAEGLRPPTRRMTLSAVVEEEAEARPGGGKGYAAAAAAPLGALPGGGVGVKLMAQGSRPEKGARL